MVLHLSERDLETGRKGRAGISALRRFHALTVEYYDRTFLVMSVGKAQLSEKEGVQTVAIKEWENGLTNHSIGLLAKKVADVWSQPGFPGSNFVASLNVKGGFRLVMNRHFLQCTRCA